MWAEVQLAVFFLSFSTSQFSSVSISSQQSLRRFLMSTPHSVPIAEQGKHLLLRWFEEVWNQSRRETIFELLAPDAVIHDGAAELRGPEAFARFHDDLRASFSDFRITPVVALAEGDFVALHWSASFRHTPTGKPATITGTSIVRVQDGLFVEGWQNWDAASLATQLAE